MYERTPLDIEYTEFVKSRFKRQDEFEQDFLHAAVGMVGEASELVTATSLPNSLEELGDIEFYFEAFQQLDWPARDQLRAVCSLPYGEPIPLVIAHFNITHTTADILDVAKKAWVYRKNVRADPEQIHRLSDAVKELRICLSAVQQHLATSRDDVRQGNMAKLRLRYPDGYTDEAAQARADKAPETVDVLEEAAAHFDAQLSTDYLLPLNGPRGIE